MKIAWLSDLHFPHALNSQIYRLVEQINKVEVDALLIGGDTGDSYSFKRYLDYLCRKTGKRVFCAWEP